MASFVQSATRQHNIDPVLGIIGGELDKKQLPSNEDIIEACMWEETKIKLTVIYPSWNVIKANVSSSVMDVPHIHPTCFRYSGSHLREWECRLTACSMGSS